MRRMLLAWLAIVLLGGAVPAYAATPSPRADPRITAAVAAWRTSPIYTDPLYAGSLRDQEKALLDRIAALEVPVFVAIVPHGTWYPEKGDTALLAGRLAQANGRPGVYVVVGTVATGVAHQVGIYAPRRAYDADDYEPVSQLGAYLDEIAESQQRKSSPKPARTTPTPERAADPPEPDPAFTAVDAIGPGLGGAFIGLLGGVAAGGILLHVARTMSARGGRR